MSYAMFAAAAWAFAAVLGRARWPRQTRVLYALIASGVPIIGWLVLSYGPWIGLSVLALGAAALRWPLPAIFGTVPGRGVDVSALGAEPGVGGSE